MTASHEPVPSPRFWIDGPAALDATGRARLLFCCFLVIWFATLALSASLSPQAFVFSDEAGYRLPAIFGATAENYRLWGDVIPQYPSHLYFKLYGLLPAAAFHETAKLLNAVFIVAAAAPAYSVGKRYLPEAWAYGFAAFVVMTPLASFVRYVMPEAMFFFGFWLCLAALLAGSNTYKASIMVGALVGLLSMVKPHAVAIALAFSLFYAIRPLGIRSAMNAILHLMAFYLTHALAGWALTGELIWSITGGSSYDGMLKPSLDISALLQNLTGHAAVLLAILGLLLFTPWIAMRRVESARTTELATISLLLLAAMVAMTSYFSQGVFQLAPDSERITRLHGRYYVFPLPLFALLGAALVLLPGIGINRGRAFVALMASSIAALLVYFYYEVGMVDHPDASIIAAGKFAILAISARFLITAGFLFKLPREHALAVSVASFVALELATGFAVVVTAPLIGLRPLPLDAVFIDRTHLPKIGQYVGNSKGAVVGSAEDAGSIAKTLFYLSSKSRGIRLGSGRGLSDEQMEGYDWILLLPSVSHQSAVELGIPGGLSIISKPVH